MARTSSRRDLPQRNQRIGGTSQKVRITIADPLSLLRDAIANQEETIAKIESHFGFYNNIVIGVFLLGYLVLIFTVVGLVVQSWQFNTTYQNESAQLKIQEDLIRNTVELQREQNDLLKTMLKRPK